MSHMSETDTRYLPAQKINEVKDLISFATTCADFPTSTLRYHNAKLLRKIGFLETSEEILQKYFCKFDPLPENLQESLALAYHGHQFGQYNPDIGDGRGFLFAQFLDDENRLLDLGTKGSGQTPFSRTGDGRLTLKGGVREALATETLETLGVRTSKTLTLFETHEQLHRGDEPSPARSSVMVRMSHSHIRFGTFQRLAYMENKAGIAEMINYCVRNYHPQCEQNDFDETVTAFFRVVMELTADMIASWMAAGFVHGVMNTDNMVITGESFDYGPYRFLPRSDPNFVAAYFDHNGRYRYGRQPEVGLWNLAQLGGALLSHSSVEKLEQVLEDYAEVYKAAFRHHMLRRLGIEPIDSEKDGEFIQSFLSWMTDSGAGFEQSIFDWFGGIASVSRAQESPQKELYNSDDFSQLKSKLNAYTPIAPERLKLAYYQNSKPITLLLGDIEGIWEKIADDDDWSAFHEHINSIRSARDL